MKTFTFFLKDDSIVEITATDAESALHELCLMKFWSRAYALGEIECCLTPDIDAETLAMA